MKRNRIVVLLCAGFFTLAGCGNTEVDPYAATCGELREDSELAEEVAAAIARDVSEQQGNTPVGLIESELDDLVDTYCSSSVDAAEKPGSSAYEEMEEWFVTGVETPRGLGGFD